MDEAALVTLPYTAGKYGSTESIETESNNKAPEVATPHAVLYTVAPLLVNPEDDGTLESAGP